MNPTVAGTPGYSHYGPAQRFWIQGSHVDAAGLNYHLRRSEAKLTGSSRSRRPA